MLFAATSSIDTVRGRKLWASAGEVGVPGEGLAPRETVSNPEVYGHSEAAPDSVDAAVPIARLENLSINSQASAGGPRVSSDNENNDSDSRCDRDLDDDDEFFDAEDATIPGQTTFDNLEELDRNAAN